MKTILMVIAFIAVNQLYSQSLDVLTYRSNLKYPNRFVIQNLPVKTDTNVLSCMIISIGLFKEFGDRYHIDEENQYKLNFGIHFFNKFNNKFGLISGVDINKAEGNGTFLHISAVPQINITEQDPNVYFGIGGVLGLVFNSSYSNALLAGILVSFRVEKNISKSLKFSIDIKHPHYFRIEVQRWDFMLNAGLTF